MKKKKLRGHRRRWKHIRKWIDSYKYLDPEYLENYLRVYAKIRVHPWSGIDLLGSITPGPTGETRTKMLEGLIEIYDEWDKVLLQRDKPYYLKIWLFDPHFSKSQVVCAVGDELNFYEHTFYKPEITRSVNPADYGRIENEIKQFTWEYRLEELHIDDDYLGDPNEYWSLKEYEKDRRWFNKIMKLPHRTTISEFDGKKREYYSFKNGVVWLGERIK